MQAYEVWQGVTGALDAQRMWLREAYDRSFLPRATLHLRRVVVLATSVEDAVEKVGRAIPGGDYWRPVLFGYWDFIESPGVGRRHLTDEDWNHAYDVGRNLAEFGTPTPPAPTPAPRLFFVTRERWVLERTSVYVRVGVAFTDSDAVWQACEKAWRDVPFNTGGYDRQAITGIAELDETVPINAPHSGIRGVDPGSLNGVWDAAFDHSLTTDREGVCWMKVPEKFE